MRRGRPGASGWCNENPRHCRSRNGGNSFYRPSRQGFASTETSRYPSPSPRHISKPHTYGNRFDNIERGHGNHSEESRYRTNRQNTYQAKSERPYRYNDRHIPPLFQKNIPVPDKPPNVYNNQTSFYNENNYLHTNSMRDVDHRQVIQNRGSFRTSTLSPWTNEARAYVHRNYESNQRNDVPEPNKIPIPEYSGHRPPSSDHYGCNPTISAIDKSNSFSRSIDDTVDMVRKRLQHRSESSNPDNFEDRQNIENQNIGKSQINIRRPSQEQPTKRKNQRQRQNDRSNCAKIKNKIVNQLFMMDKDRIHKLMDNPNSSTKFEFAINSLITESQNSFNRHLRSVAEKSLCSTSDDFIKSDSNTIYEDTFMKQMQCILDPQDTVLLGDIKPMVMAELNNILQLDNFNSNFEEETPYRKDEYINYNQYQNNNSRIENTSNDDVQEHHSLSNLRTDCASIETVHHENRNYNVQAQQSDHTQYWPLFERRTRRISKSLSTDIPTTESQYHNTNENMVPTLDNVHHTQQLFDTNSKLSEEDDTFAELDNQYHVAVDRDFIEQDDTSTQHIMSNTMNASNIESESNVENQTDNLREIKEENIDNQYVDSAYVNIIFEEQVDTYLTCPHAQSGQVDNLPVQSSNTLDETDAYMERERTQEQNNIYQAKKRSNDDIRDTKSPSNSRKRTSDLKPSHRKEKRKKSESNQVIESSKQILNKISVNDCANKLSEKCEAPKSIFNLFFSKEKAQTVSKDISMSSDKRINKKETAKTPEEKGKKSRKKHNSTSSSHSTSPKDSNSLSNNSLSSKLDTKAALKPIDMFTEQPRKVNIHHAHRNTALTPKIDATKDNIENKLIDKAVLNKPISKSHASVQVCRKMHNKETQTVESKKQTTRFCQTEQETFAVKATQSDIEIEPEKPRTNTTDVFERMKEIDLEIQVLLQEKFKLYSSIESKESSTNSLQNLGMTVLNVSPFEEEDIGTNVNITAEDVIMDELNIPNEVFEQIIMDVEKEEKKVNKYSNRNRKTSSKHSHDSHESATSSKRNKTQKPPNVSLLEQIITDDRPLENNISLNDYEIFPIKKRGKNKRIYAPKKKSVLKNILKTYHKKYNLKECSVVLTREIFHQYCKDSSLQNDYHNNIPVTVVTEDSSGLDQNIQQNDVVEVTVDNGVQFDMLDVSEDIIIGDIYEVKSDNDKEVVVNVSLRMNEGIILDNSQSSMEEASAPVIGQGDECKVYDYSADENLRRDSVLVAGNADAVLAIECVENNFLAASLDGNVYYFNGDGQLISTLRGSNLAVTCLTIVKERYDTTVYTGSLDSRIRYYDLETGIEKGPECNVLSPIQTMDRAWDTVFVGTRTGFVLQFECKNNMLIPVSTVKFSEQSILALRAMKEGPRKVLLVAARSENVTIKDAQSGLLLRTLAGPKMTVYSLLYEDGKVYCGTSSHQIHVFEYASGSHAGTHSGGKGAVCLRAKGGLVFAGCYDGCVYVFREGESEPRAQLRGPSLMLLSLAVLDTKVIAGYKDRSLYIWKIPLCILQEMIL